MKRINHLLTALPFMLLACSSGPEPTEEATGVSRAAVIYDGTTKQTNIFHGTVTLGSTDASVFALLNTYVASWGGFVFANSSIPGVGASMLAPGNGTLSMPYELSTEASTTGLSYTVQPLRGVWFPPQSATLDMTPGGVALNFSQDVGLAELHISCNGTEFTPNTADVAVRADPNGIFFDTVGQRYYVLTSGQPLDIYVTLMTGSSWSVDRIQQTRQVSTPGTINTITPESFDFDCGGGGGSLGELRGRYDVEGEVERNSVYTAIGGRTDGNYRDFSATIPPFVADPSGSEWVLPNLLTDDQWNSIGLNGSIRQNHQFTYFEAGRVDPTGPAIAPGPQYLAPEPFVMRPAFLRGTLNFLNPELPLPIPAPGALWSWGSLARVADGPFPQLQSSIQAGAQNGGYAATSFDGTFNPLTHSFTSSYELPLLMGNDATGTWGPALQLTFLSGPNPDPTQFREGGLQMAVANSSRSIAPGAFATVDYEACFNEVVMDLTLVGDGELVNPGAQIRGSFSGFDPNLGKTLDYSIQGGFRGLTTSSPAKTATVSFPIPRGGFTITPVGQVTTPGGFVNDASFSALLLNAGCGQLIYLRDIGVSVDWAQTCLSGPEVNGNASVSVSASGNQVTRVWYTVNDGAEVELCNGDCAVDTPIELVVPDTSLQPGQNKIQVFAESPLHPELPGSTVTFVGYDPGGNDPTCSFEPPEAAGACVVGTESVQARDYSNLDATVSTSYLTLAAGAHVVHDAAARFATLGPSSAIDGTLTYENPPTIDPSATIGAALAGSIAVPVVPSQSVPVGTGACSVSPDATTTLAPGNCQATVIGARSTVTFGPGTYTFDSLRVEPDAHVILNGDVTFLVQNDADFESRVNYSRNGAGSFLVYSNRNINVYPGVSAFPGSLQAPLGAAHVYSNVSLHGAVAARNVIVEPWSQVICDAPIVPPTPSCSDAAQNGNETGVDCGGACTPCPSCTDGAQNGDETGVDCGGACPTCVAACTLETAIDLRTVNASTTVKADACLKVTQFPGSWLRNVVLQSQAGGSGFDMPLTWSNTCSGHSGSAVLGGNWSQVSLGPVSTSCPVLIKLNGPSNRSVPLTWWGNG